MAKIKSPSTVAVDPNAEKTVVVYNKGIRTFQVTPDSLDRTKKGIKIGPGREVKVPKSIALKLQSDYPRELKVLAA